MCYAIGSVCVVIIMFELYHVYCSGLGDTYFGFHFTCFTGLANMEPVTSTEFEIRDVGQVIFRSKQMLKRMQKLRDQILWNTLSDERLSKIASELEEMDVCLENLADMFGALCLQEI